MNDKKFIEELKFKREEYGVSQKRLAVACGISREHYNRIETGKLPLTEELKAEIQKQLERLNPLEPMFILVDYFRVRFPNKWYLNEIRKSNTNFFTCSRSCIFPCRDLPWRSCNCTQ